MRTVRVRRIPTSAWPILRMRHEICSALVAGALALGNLFAIAPIPAATEASAPPCVAPADVTRLDLPLKRTARHLASRKLIMIVALGSSSTAGAGASDPQFAPKVLAQPEIEDMVDLISSAVRQEHVDLFHRFALMRHWHDIDGIPFEAFLSSDGLHMNDWSYSCFAKALADAITDAATPDRGEAAAAKTVAGETR